PHIDGADDFRHNSRQLPERRAAGVWPGPHGGRELARDATEERHRADRVSAAPDPGTAAAGRVDAAVTRADHVPVSRPESPPGDAGGACQGVYQPAGASAET
ncbi:hypothetical protein HK405_000529, partial [Cladochytrium tenue]